MPCSNPWTEPLNWAAGMTWLAISVAAVDFGQLVAGTPRIWAGSIALLLMLLGFMRVVSRPISQTMPGRAETLVVLQGVATLVAEHCVRQGQILVLLIIVAAQLMHLPNRWRAMSWLGLFNSVMFATWLQRDVDAAQALLWLLPLVGFQAFAAMSAHYQLRSETAHEALSAAHAELQATQCLLEESARAGERLALSRELHDVAGHKLTALKLHLARLVRDPELADREALLVSRELADELLGDIRGVVSELRQHDGLDLQAALHALARPVAGVQILMEVDPQLRVRDVAQAEAILRTTQEGITNALRHARANQIRVVCRQTPEGIELDVQDDGHATAPPTFGNGLLGMRERLHAVGGELSLQTASPHGLRLQATIRGPMT